MKTHPISSRATKTSRRTRPAVLATSIAALLGLTALGLAPSAHAQQYWDGPNLVPNNVIDGGTGSWDNVSTNWTNAAGTVNSLYNPATASFFQGTSGTVTIGPSGLAFTQLTFVTSGYTIAAGAGGSLAVNGATNIVVNSPGTATISAQMVNAGSLTVGNAGVTGTLILTNAANNFSGGITLTGTTTLLNNAATSALGSGAVTINGALSTFGTGLTAATITNDLVVNNNFSLTAASGGTGLALTNVNLDGTTRTITSVGGGAKTINGTIAAGAGVGVTYEGAGGIITYGATSVSTYTGVTTVQNGAQLNLASNNSNNAIVGNVVVGSTGIVQLNAANQIADGATLTVNTDGRFNLNNFSETIKILNSGANGGLVALQGGTLTVSSGDFSGNINDGGGVGGNILKTGLVTDVLKLSGNNAYTGTTNINSGTILAGSTTAFSKNSSFILATTGATLDLGGFNNGVSALTGGLGSVVQNSVATAAVLTVSGTTSTVFSGNMIGNQLGLTKSGASTITLGGNNTYAGATRITTGSSIIAASTTGLSLNSAFNVEAGATLSLGGFSNTIASLSDGGTAGGIVNNGGAGPATLTFGDATNTTYKGTIVNGGAGVLNLVKQGAGTTVFGGANTYTGTTTITGGTLKGGANNVFGSNSAVTVGAAGTLDLGGFDQAIGSLAGVTGAVVTNSSVDPKTLTTGADNTSTEFAGVIKDGTPNGILNLTKVGNGILKLSGVNTYTGTTNVNAGTLQMGVVNALSTATAVSVANLAIFDLNNFNQSIGSLAGVAGSTVNLGTATLKTGSNNTNTTFTGLITGTGKLEKLGTGTMTIDGAAPNTFNGGTLVDDGTLILAKTAGVNALGTGPITIGDGVGAPLSAILQLNTANQIADTTAVTLLSDGLFNVNSLTETIGSLAGASATSQVNLGAGTLITGDANSTSFAGNIIGVGGSLTKQGTGTFTVSGNNTYTGATVVNAGVLKAGSTTGFAQFSAFTVNANSTLDLGGFNSNIGSLAGGGVNSFVTNNGAAASLTTGNDNTSTSYGGIIKDGTGVLSLIKVGTGTQTLTGANTYTGGTTLNSGGIHVDNNFALGTGTLTINNAAPGGSKLGSGVGGITFANAITVNADFAVDPTGILTATGAVTLNGLRTITGTTAGAANQFVFAGPISGGTGLTLDSAVGSFFVFSGTSANTYGGLTTVQGSGTQLDLNKTPAGTDAVPGNLTVKNTAVVRNLNSNQINDMATVTLLDNGLWNLNSYNETITTLNTQVNTTVRLDDGSVGGTLTVTNGLVDGVITDNFAFPGGNLVKNGGSGDALTLTNSNNYNGLTTLNGGLLNINDGGALGNSTFQIMGNDDVLVGNTSGSQVFFFNTTDIYKNFSVNGPDLLTDGGFTTLRQMDTTINTIAGGLNFSNAIAEFSPLSTLTFTGNTATTFSGSTSNTYTGITTLEGGVLTLAKTNNATAIAGDLRIMWGTTVKYGSGGAVTNHQIATGSDVDVHGTLDLNGHVQEIDTLSGDGLVRLGDAATMPGKLLVHNGSFSGVIADAGPSGTLDKTTPGTLYLSGQNTLTGLTTVQAGALILDGSVGGDLSVFSPGFLGGTGWVGGSVVNSGVLSPGHSPGVFTINHNYTQTSTGLLKIEIGGLNPGESDLLVVHGAAILGGSVEVIRLNNFQLKRGQKVVFLTADGGVFGTFANEDNQFEVGNSLLDGKIIYEPYDVALTLVQNSFLDTLHGLTPNQKAVAGALDKVLNNSNMFSALDYLDYADINDVPHLLDLIAPEELQALYTIGVSQANVQTANLQRRMDDIRSGAIGFSAAGLAVNGLEPQYSSNYLTPNNGVENPISGLAGPEGKVSKEIRPPVEPNRLGVFVTGTGEWSRIGSTYNASGYDLSSGGFTLGVDYRIGENFAVGFNAGYAHTDADLFGAGNIGVDGAKFGIYGTFFTGGFYIDASVQGGYNSYDTRRTALGGSARGSTEGMELNTLASIGYDFRSGGLTAGVFANFQYTNIGFDGFSESGSLVPLTYSNQSQESMRTALGAKASYEFHLGTVIVKPEVRAAWQHEFGDSAYAIDSKFRNAGNSSFTVHGAEIGDDSLLLGAGFAILWNERTSTYIYYDGEIGRSNFDSNNVSGGFRMSF